MAPVVIVAPSQTSHCVRMGEAWIERSSAARRIVEEADRILGDTFGELPSLILRQKFLNSETCQDAMSRTDIPQICIYISSMACWAGLEQFGIVNLKDIVAGIGLSFGELALLTISKSISYEDCLKFIAKRSKIMQKTIIENPGKVLALVTTDRDILQDIISSCKKSSILQILRVKNTTSLLTGKQDAIERAMSYSLEKYQVKSFVGIDCAAFHSDLIKPAVDEVIPILKTIDFNATIFPVISNVTALPFTKDIITDFLAEGMTTEIRWRESCVYINERWPEAKWFVLEPGLSLSNELRRTLGKTDKEVLYADDPHSFL